MAGPVVMVWDLALKDGLKVWYFIVEELPYSEIKERKEYSNKTFYSLKLLRQTLLFHLYIKIQIF